MSVLTETNRLSLRDWSPDDADAALAVFGASAVTKWLTPAMERIADPAAMRSVLQDWSEQQHTQPAPRGHWAVQHRDTGQLLGGVAIRLLPPFEEDLEISWQLDPSQWGHGYATEAAAALTQWAFTQEIDELFAVTRPQNARAIAVIGRLGMQWVGETTKYYGLRLQVYRIRPSDLTAGDSGLPAREQVL